MIRPINRSIPFDFGPLLGPLAEPSGNPPPPDDPFGGRDLFAPEDPNKKHPFDGPIKPKPNPFKDYPWPDEDIRVQDPRDKVPIDGPIKRNPIKDYPWSDDIISVQHPINTDLISISPIKFDSTTCRSFQICIDYSVGKEWFYDSFYQRADLWHIMPVYINPNDISLHFYSKYNHDLVLYDEYQIGKLRSINVIDDHQNQDIEWKEIWLFSLATAYRPTPKPEVPDYPPLANEFIRIPIDSKTYRFQHRPQPLYRMIRGKAIEYCLFMRAWTDINGCGYLCIWEGECE